MTRRSELSLKALAGASAVVIEGESQAEYDRGRKTTIQELAATSPLEIYLAEKMFDCLWWIRRLDSIRVSVIQKGMFESLGHVHRNKGIKALLDAEAWDDPSLQEALRDSGTTRESLPAAGMVKAQDSLESLDKQTAFRLKMFRDLQKA